MIGKNKLGGLVKKMCSKAGFTGNFNNHSGKVTCATEVSIVTLVNSSSCGRLATAVVPLELTSELLLSCSLRRRFLIVSHLQSVKTVQSAHLTLSAGCCLSFRVPQSTPYPLNKLGAGCHLSCQILH